MSDQMALNEHLTSSGREHSHVFLGEGHAGNERRTWIVIALCGVMMLAEIVGGTLFGSLALVADGLHMSTHAGALLLAALAYTFSRKYAHDRRFSFGTGPEGTTRAVSADTGGQATGDVGENLARAAFRDDLEASEGA